MKRVIKDEPKLMTSTSFDGKHTIVFNEGSHRYKMHGRHAVGTTTYTKAGYPTSMGLISWMKSQTADALFQALTVPGNDGFYPREGFWPINEAKKEDLITEAKKADLATSRQAADIGTICHGFAELHSLGRHDEAKALLENLRDVPAWPLIHSCVTKYLEWDLQNRGKLVCAEALVGYVCEAHEKDNTDKDADCSCFCGKFDRLDNVGGKLILRDYKTSKDIFLDQYIQLGAYSLAIRRWLGMEVEGLEVLRFGKDDGSFETLLVDDPKEIKMMQQQALRCYGTYKFRKFENDPRWAWEGNK